MTSALQTARDQVGVELRAFAGLIPAMFALFEHRPEQNDLPAAVWHTGIEALAESLRHAVAPCAPRLPAPLAKVLEMYEPECDFEFYGERIRWLLSIHMPVRWESERFQQLSLANCSWALEAGGDSRGAAKQWFLDAPPSVTWPALCAALPSLADDDPEFALRLLDDEGRIPSDWIRCVRHNALVHVVAALANNQFQEIRRFLNLEAAAGPYAFLIPRYVGAILLAKARALRTTLADLVH